MPGNGRLTDAQLASSSVVANNAMNRQRGLRGVNSYARALGFDPLDVLGARRAADPAADPGWLDLCCGAGLALIEAAGALAGDPRVRLVGVDLVDFFAPVPAGNPAVELHTAPVSTWVPDGVFDLITCVHGLHYVGDKLGLLARTAGWLAPGGLLVADLDLDAVRRPDGEPAGPRLAAALRAAGFGYDPRRHRIRRTGPGAVTLPYAYLGADDRAGPNYTGQPAVHSYYAELP